MRNEDEMGRQAIRVDNRIVICYPLINDERSGSRCI